LQGCFLLHLKTAIQQRESNVSWIHFLEIFPDLPNDLVLIDGICYRGTSNPSPPHTTSDALIGSVSESNADTEEVLSISVAVVAIVFLLIIIAFVIFIVYILRQKRRYSFSNNINNKNAMPQSNNSDNTNQLKIINSAPTAIIRHDSDENLQKNNIDENTNRNALNNVNREELERGESWRTIVT